MSKKVLEVKNVKKKYGEKQILRKVNINISEASATVLIGKNGAGKTTLLKILYRFQGCDAGYVSIFGNEEYSLSKIGVVPQENYFDNDLNVFYNLYYQLKSIKKMSKKQLEQKIDEKLYFVGALSLKNRDISELSGGEKRKIALARALLNDPNLLLLDEPTEGVDIQSKLEFWSKLDYLKKAGIAILLTTHHYDEMEAVADEVVLLSEGETEYLGHITEFEYSDLLNIFKSEEK